MKKQLYPAVLERGPKGTFGAWFPDFPGCVTAGKTLEEARRMGGGSFGNAYRGNG